MSEQKVWLVMAEHWDGREFLGVDTYGPFLHEVSHEEATRLVTEAEIRDMVTDDGETEEDAAGYVNSNLNDEALRIEVRELTLKN